LQDLKSKLDMLSSVYLDKLQNVDEKEEKWKSLEEKSKEILQNNPHEIIKLNIGGTLFETKPSTLLSVPDTLFSQILTNRTNNSEEIFIDRNPQLFVYLLEYLRTGNLNVKRLKKKILYEECLEEAKYYGINQLSSSIKNKVSEVKFVKFETNGLYPGSPSSITVISDRNLGSAILTNSPGWMIVEFDSQVEFDQLEIGGYTGEGWNYPTGYGAGGNISTSTDKKNWNVVGTIPTGFGNTIMKVKLTSSCARYIKFESNTWLSVGFLNILL